MQLSRERLQVHGEAAPAERDGVTVARNIRFTYDLGTQKRAGDVSGGPGTYTVIGTNGQGIKARVVFEVGVK